MIFCGHSRKQSQARPVNPGRYSGVDRMPGGGTEQRLKAQRAANIDIDMLRYVLSFFSTTPGGTHTSRTLGRRSRPKYEGHVAPRSFFAAFAWDEETAETTMLLREPTQAEPFAVAHKQNLSLSLSGKSTKASLHLVASLRRLRPQ